MTKIDPSNGDIYKACQVKAQWAYGIWIVSYYY